MRAITNRIRRLEVWLALQPDMEAYSIVQIFLRTAPEACYGGVITGLPPCLVLAGLASTGSRSDERQGRHHCGVSPAP